MRESVVERERERAVERERQTECSRERERAILVVGERALVPFPVPWSTKRGRESESKRKGEREE